MNMAGGITRTGSWTGITQDMPQMSTDNGILPMDVLTECNYNCFK